MEIRLNNIESSNPTYDEKVGLISGFILKAGKFVNSTDAKTIEITEDDLRVYVDNYNSLLKSNALKFQDPSDKQIKATLKSLLQKIGLYKNDLSCEQGIEVCLDHISEARTIVGKTVGLMSLEKDLLDGQMGIKCSMLITREDIKQSIKNGALKYFSIGGSKTNLKEISLVYRGACKTARVTSIELKALNEDEIKNEINLEKQIAEKEIKLKNVILDKNFNNMIKLGSISPASADIIKKSLTNISSIQDMENAFNAINLALLAKPVHNKPKNLNLFSGYETKGKIMENKEIKLEDVIDAIKDSENVNFSASEVAPPILNKEKDDVLSKELVFSLLQENKIDELMSLSSSVKNEISLAEKQAQQEKDDEINRLKLELAELKQKKQDLIKLENDSKVYKTEKLSLKKILVEAIAEDKLLLAKILKEDKEEESEESEEKIEKKDQKDDNK